MCVEVAPGGSGLTLLSGLRVVRGRSVGFGLHEAAEGVAEGVGDAVAGAGGHVEVAERLDVAADGGLTHPGRPLACGVVDEAGGGSAGGDQGAVCGCQVSVAAEDGDGAFVGGLGGAAAWCAACRSHPQTVGPMMGRMAAARPSSEPGEVDLVLTDVGQARAVHAAVYRSARTAGLLHERADRVAAHAAAHLVGQLRAQGYRLSVEWVSDEARDALQATWRGPGPELADPNSITWEEPEGSGPAT